MGQAANLLHIYYLSIEQYDSALFYFKKYIPSRSNKKANYVLLMLESEIIESKNAEQKNALLARNLAMQENLNSSLIFAFLILIIFIVMVVRNNNVIKNKNEDLRKEKEHNARLLKEIHHRVKNNLQMIVGLLDLQQSSTTDHDVSLVLNDAGSRVRSIALIHQSLYKGDTDMVSIGFNKYIAELCDSLVYSYNMSDTLDVELDIDEINLPFNRAVILGLLITELVTNVLKHAFVDRSKGSLTISIKKNNNEVRLIVSDDGVGISDDFNQKSSSFGLDLINSFVKDLGGQVRFSNDNGTKVEVILTDLDAN
jgi:two-component sensor histidine kinase